MESEPQDVMTFRRQSLSRLNTVWLLSVLAVVGLSGRHFFGQGKLLEIDAASPREISYQVNLNSGTQSEFEICQVSDRSWLDRFLNTVKPKAVLKRW